LMKYGLLPVGNARRTVNLGWANAGISGTNVA
jgi:hypothetical protein